MNPAQLLAHHISASHNANVRRDFDSAATLARRALQLRPDVAEAWYQLGIALRGLGQKAEALKALMQAAKQTQASPDAQNAIGLELLEACAYPEAEQCLMRAIRLAPQFASAYSNLGKLRICQERLADAEKAIRHAAELAPTSAPIHVNLGGVLNSLKQYPAAEAACRTAVELDPFSFGAWSNLSSALCGLEQFEAAEAACRKAIELDPHAPDPWINLGALLLKAKRLADAEAACRKAIELNANIAEAWCNLGAIFIETGSFSDARQALERALKLDPGSSDTHTNLATCLLSTGDYPTGFAEYEYRWGARSCRSTRPSTNLPQWRGEPVSDHAAILVFSEQGLGDILQFSRYLPLLREHFARVRFICPEPLHRLFETCFGDRVEIASPNDEIDFASFQWHCPLLSLALAFGTTWDSVPGTPYLFAKTGLTKNNSGVLRIGLAWRGNPNQADDRWRSIPLQRLSELLNMENIEWVSLQKDHFSEDTPLLQKFGVRLASLADFADTAALMSSVDLVISTDTSVPHLAGAMGKPIWLLNRATSDWRWGWRQVSTPWYPSMRIFNQEVLGNWEALIEHVTGELRLEYPRLAIQNPPS